MAAKAARDGRMFENIGKVPVNVKLIDAPAGAAAAEMFEKLDIEKTGKITHS